MLQPNEQVDLAGAWWLVLQRADINQVLEAVLNGLSQGSGLTPMMMPC
ncbi:hypothetical protein [Metapseudomonas boanensis]|uniref:Uncharacterized protein n=1 Tax=Metapseudomonas boanensis TaxID=2822138 RepID=A0ABS5XG38_9GAMM|nr:hypothetical protein [Pseudomonas boanensis]MBT8766642.1 hypothetical protein [Pseudomonas boanensis]